MTAERKAYKIYIPVLLGLALLLPALVNAGSPKTNGLVEFSCKKYPFVHSDRNEIVGAHVLDSLFQKMYLQRTEHNQRIHILQIGDSHIQADFSSAQVRANIQADFGNAGRGVVVPLRVAKSNEPFNYKITSNVVCTSKRCVFVDDPMPIGIGGVTIQSFSDSINFHIKTFDYPPVNYGFNKVTLFYRKDSASYNFVVEDSLGKNLGTINASGNSAYPNTSVVQLPQLTNDIVIKAQKANEAQTNAMIFGLNLENDSAGVIYSAVGVNGAEAFQYARAKYFAEQTAAIQPQLIVISLGTNEAQRRPFDKELMQCRLDSLVKELREANPKTPIILATPPDSYFHKKYYNPSVAAIHTVIVDYAKENHLAVWDLFSATGGFKSCYQWKRYGLMRSDGIHFTRAGYELQGNLFYEALIKAYNNYVTHRLP